MPSSGDHKIECTCEFGYVSHFRATKAKESMCKVIKKYGAVHCTIIPKRRIYLCLIGAKLNVFFVCYLLHFMELYTFKEENVHF